MPDWLILIYAFIIGTLFGSFSTAIAWRTINKDVRDHEISQEIKDKNSDKNKYSIWTGRSMCAHCRNTLPWYALIPVFSYIFLRGKCFSCKHHISIFYPIVETIFGIFTLILIKNYYIEIFDLHKLVLYFVTFWILMILALQDAWWEEISDKIAIPGFVIICAIQIYYAVTMNDMSYLINVGISAVVLVIIFTLLVLFTEGMGGGDLRAFGIMGMALGFPGVLIALCISFVVASIGGISQALYSKSKKIGKYHVRLIPYLALGFIVVSLWSGVVSFFIPSW